MLLHISQSEAFVCPMRANSTSWEAYKDLSFFATYWMERNSFFARCEIQMIHWSTGKVFRPVSTSYACQLNFLGSIQGFILRWTAPVSTSYACQLNFLGRIYPSLRPIEWKEIPSLLDVKYKWYIEALGRFSDRSQLPMRANSTSWEAYKDLSFGELLLNYWTDRHEIL